MPVLLPFPQGKCFAWSVLSDGHSLTRSLSLLGLKVRGSPLQPVDLTDHPIPPVDRVLGILTYLAQAA
jgi:hypothetical protein